MKSLRNCRFCDIISGEYQYIGIDEPFASNDEFIAIASIGALVEGWTLVVPKEHRLSMRKFYNSIAFKNFINSLLPRLFNSYGPLITFEHGANKEGSITACGTDHAHLHLVPLGESLLSKMITSGLEWIKCHSSEIARISGKNEYLFYSELNIDESWQDPLGYLHVLEHPISQFFRQVIYKQRGLSDVSDYKRFPHLDTARQTRSALSGSFV